MLKRMLFFLVIPFIDLAALFAMTSIIIPVMASIPPVEGQFLIPSDMTFYIDVRDGSVLIEDFEYSLPDLEDALSSRINRAAIIRLKPDTTFSRLEPVLRALTNSGIKHAGYEIK